MVILSRVELDASPVLYVRATPKGEYYVSTQQDREHSISAGLIAFDANAHIEISDTISAHLQPWAKQADSLITR